MFSEYASKFLSQSNYRQPENNDSNSRISNQRRANTQRGPSRLAFQHPSPYLPTASGLTLPFGSRYSAAPDAPLFHSTLQEFQEEDSYEEHQRYAADFAALQQSRRAFGVFGGARQVEESESDGGSEESGSAHQEHGDRRTTENLRRGRGIRSSWTGHGKRAEKGRAKSPEVEGEAEDARTDSMTATRIDSLTTRPKNWWRSDPVPVISEDSSSKGHGAMEDVKLASTIGGSEPPDDLTNEVPGFEDTPPDPQRFRYSPDPTKLNDPNRRVEDIEASAGTSRRLSTETVPPFTPPGSELPKHDVFYGSLYLIGMAGMFATYFLVLLHTETPSGKLPDTIYSSLQSSRYILAVDTVFAVFVALLWFALLRSFAKPLVYLLVTAVPVVLFSFGIYVLTASFNGTERTRLQDWAMGWLSFIPLVGSFLWCYLVYKSRHSITRTGGILDFSTRILAANPALLPMGFVTLITIISFTWIWILMFMRVFLGGHFAPSRSIFVIDGVTWWLGLYFVVMYLWTISMISGIQRATTGATVSQWYFHRNQFPAVSSQETVKSAFIHATTTLFGTISFSTFLALLIRLPLLLLPRRFSRIFTAVAYNFIPNSVVALMDPLTLTYAAIHSQPLQTSAQGISSMHFLSQSSPTTLNPRTFSARNHAPLEAYRLTKLILHATRFIMAIGLGSRGWVAAARQLSVEAGNDIGLKGSAYAYVVGLIAGFIGWTILGAMEGVLSGVVDSVVICYGSENNGLAHSGAYCLEAAHLFGDEGRGDAY